MSIKALSWAFQQHIGSEIGKLVLVIVAIHCDDDWSCFPSQKLLARECEVSDRTVRKWLANLEERGLLKRQQRRRQNGSRTTDLITLLPGPNGYSGAQAAKRHPAEEGTQRNLVPTSSEACAGPESSVENNIPPSPPDHRQAALDVSEESQSLRAFKRAFPTPSENPSLVREIWNSLMPEDRKRVIGAAREYAAWTRRRKRRRTKSQEDFLRDPLVWDEFYESPPGNVCKSCFVRQGSEEWAAWNVHFAIIDPAHAPIKARPSTEGVLGKTFPTALPPGGRQLAEYADEDGNPNLGQWCSVDFDSPQWEEWDRQVRSWTGRPLSLTNAAVEGSEQTVGCVGTSDRATPKKRSRLLPTMQPRKS